MGGDQVAVFPCELLDALVGDGGAVVGADETGLRLGDVADEFLGGVPGLGFGFTAEDLQAHAEADLAGAVVAGGGVSNAQLVGGTNAAVAQATAGTNAVKAWATAFK